MAGTPVAEEDRTAAGSDSAAVWTVVVVAGGLVVPGTPAGM